MKFHILTALEVALQSDPSQLMESVGCWKNLMSGSCFTAVSKTIMGVEQPPCWVSFV